MEIIKTIPPADEFNYMPMINWHKRDINKKYRVICFESHDILFPNFDEIITVNKQMSLKEKNFYSISKKTLELEKDLVGGVFISGSDLLGSLRVYGNKHVYDFCFSKLSQELQEGRGSFFNPKKSDYLEIKDKLKHVNKKIVSINGRCLNKWRDFGRNRNFIGLIEELLKNDIAVVNCTYPKNDIKVDDDNYIDASSDCLSYSRNISYFLNSNALVSIANAGGITNHISTDSNIILYGQGGWVDNPKFGFNNISIYDARLKFGKNTFKANSLEAVLNIVKYLDKPVVTKFFDESKIKSIKEFM